MEKANGIGRGNHKRTADMAKGRSEEYCKRTDLLGVAFATALAELGLSANRVAAIANVDATQVSKWTNNKSYESRLYKKVTVAMYRYGHLLGFSNVEVDEIASRELTANQQEERNEVEVWTRSIVRERANAILSKYAESSSVTPQIIQAMDKDALLVYAQSSPERNRMLEAQIEALRFALMMQASIIRKI